MFTRSEVHEDQRSVMNDFVGKKKHKDWRSVIILLVKK